MSLRKSKCWYSDNCLHFYKHAVPFVNVLMNNKVFLEHCRNVKPPTQFLSYIIYVLKYCSIYLVRGAIYELSSLLHKDALCHLKLQRL